MFLFGKDEKSQVLKAKEDSRAKEELIRQKETAILKIASKTCGKYVTKSDDEFSIALYAFSRSIDEYEEGRGDFMAFAATLIKRDLIDYHRHEELHSVEFSVSPSAFSDDGEENESAVTYEINRVSVERFNNSLAEEISDLTETLKEFDIDFMELTECSPKQDRTRKECLKVSKFLSEEKELAGKMMKNHLLPASEIIKKTGVSGKLLDKYRKYIITCVIILNDEYPQLSGYLDAKRMKTA